jgi:hypothetical protein
MPAANNAMRAILIGAAISFIVLYFFGISGC